MYHPPSPPLQIRILILYWSRSRVDDDDWLHVGRRPRRQEGRRRLSAGHPFRIQFVIRLLVQTSRYLFRSFFVLRALFYLLCPKQSSPFIECVRQLWAREIESGRPANGCGSSEINLLLLVMTERIIIIKINSRNIYWESSFTIIYLELEKNRNFFL